MNRFRNFVDGEKSASHGVTFFIGNRSLVSAAVLKLGVSRSKNLKGISLFGWPQKSNKIGHANPGVCFSKLLKTFWSEKLFYVQAIYQHIASIVFRFES